MINLKIHCFLSLPYSANSQPINPPNFGPIYQSNNSSRLKGTSAARDPTKVSQSSVTPELREPVLYRDPLARYRQTNRPIYSDHSNTAQIRCQFISNIPINANREKISQSIDIRPTDCNPSTLNQSTKPLPIYKSNNNH